MSKPKLEMVVPYKEYKLVRADGSTLDRSKKHPFCMSRVHYSATGQLHSVTYRACPANLLLLSASVSSTSKLQRPGYQSPLLAQHHSIDQLLVWRVHYRCKSTTGTDAFSFWMHTMFMCCLAFMISPPSTLSIDNVCMLIKLLSDSLATNVYLDSEPTWWVGCREGRGGLGTAGRWFLPMEADQLHSHSGVPEGTCRHPS